MKKPNNKKRATKPTDSARLSWLLRYIQRNGTSGMLDVWAYSLGGPLGRDAIDRAMIALPNPKLTGPQGPV